MIQQVAKLKEIVNQNSMGHLPLPYRVDLMKQIGDTRIIQKILCECCKKVCLRSPKEIGNVFDIDYTAYDLSTFIKANGNESIVKSTLLSIQWSPLYQKEIYVIEPPEDCTQLINN